MNILIADNGLPFDLNTPYIKPLGGSETSAILLTKGLSQLKNNIVILSSDPEAQINNNIKKDHIINFDQYAEIADIIILNRWIPQTLLKYTSDKPVYYYCHDAYDQQNIQWLSSAVIDDRNKPSWSIFEKILCVSEWQKNTFIKYFNVDPNKLEVLNNSLDRSLYVGYKKRNLNKLIFSSIPYKGLDVLPELFNDFMIKTKSSDMELHIHSSMDLYNNSEANREYAETYFKLSKTKNVYLNNLLSMKELAHEFMTSSIYLHPNTYHETFGMVLTQAQAAGCIPITTNKGAVNEVIDNNETGYIIDEPNIEYSSTYNKFLDKMVDVYNKTREEDGLYNMRIKAQNKAKNWDYLYIAKKLVDIIEKRG